MAVNEELDTDIDSGDELDDDIEVIVDDEEVVEDAADTEDAAEEDEAPVEAEPAPVDAVADEPEPTADDTDDDPELANARPKVSEMVRKRLERERRKHEQVLTSIVQEREQIRSAAVQVAQIAKQNEEEITTLRRQNAQLQRHFAETLDYAYERDINVVAQEVRKAREDGDYDAEMKAQAQLDHLRFTLNQIRQQKSSLPDPEKIEPVSRVATTTVETPAAPEARKPPPSELAVKWLDRNKSWFFKPEYAAYRAFTETEDRRLAAEGYDKNDAAYYKELDRRIDKAFPTLRKRPTRTGSSPVAPANSAPARNLSSKTVRITPQDKMTMKRFGLDPSNKEHLREFARTKRPA